MYSSLSFVALKNTKQHQGGGEKELIHFTGYIVHHLRKPRQKLETETSEEHCLLAYCLWLAQMSFLQSPGSTAMDWNTHSRLDLPTSISNQADASQTWLQVILLQANLWLAFPFQGDSRFVLSLYLKLTMTVRNCQNKFQEIPGSQKGKKSNGRLCNEGAWRNNHVNSFEGPTSKRNRCHIQKCMQAGRSMLEFPFP